MEPTPMKIQKLIDMYVERDLLLPEMQRKYIWKSTQIRDLIDSIYRDYPSGAILLWDSGEALPETKETPLKSNRIQSIGKKYLLLDGQQRITSLATIMAGHPIRIREGGQIKERVVEIYLNLDHPEKTAFEDEDTKGLFFQVKNSKIKNQTNWISVNKLFEKGVASILKELKIDYDNPKYETWYERLNRLYNRKETYIYPVQILPKDKSYDEVTEVFVRVNSMGTRLRGSDLALAQVTSRWPGSMSIFEDFVEECQKMGFYIDSGFLIRCVVALATGQSRFRTIGNISIETIKKNWWATRKAVQYAINFIKSNAKIEGTGLIPSVNLLIPIVAFAEKKKYELTPEEEKGLLTWFFSAGMWGRYARGSSESLLDKDLSSLRLKRPTEGLLDNLTDQVGRIKVSESDLREKTTNSPFFMMMYVLCKDKKAKDWGSGLVISAQHAGNQFKIEKDHIFPKSKLEPYLKEKKYEEGYRKKLVNEIANIGFLSRRANGIKATESPSDYLPKITDRIGEAALTSQMIPVNKELWDIGRYEDFLRERRTIIAEEINNFIDSIRAKQARPKAKTVTDIINEGESESVEFKSSLRWDYKERRDNRKVLEPVIAKTISAFLNTFGGTLIIGVDDTGNVLGLQKDFSIIKDKNEDGFERALTDLTNLYIGKEFRKYIHVNFENVTGKVLCIVKVEKAPCEAYTNISGKNEFFIREGNSTHALDVKQAKDYIRHHWQ